MNLPTIQTSLFSRTFVLVILGTVLACGQQRKTRTPMVPIDTTVVDDDTLETNTKAVTRPVEHAR